MGSVTATLGVDRSHDPSARYSNRAIGIRRDDERTYVSRFSDPSGGNVDAHQEVARLRQRSLLAKLVHALEPIEAESIAIRLLGEFGSLGEIFNASTASLTRAIGDYKLADLIQNARYAVEESLREQITRTTFDIRDERLSSYIVAIMQGECEEHLHAIFLNKQLHYLRDERIASGTWDHIALRLRPLLKRAIELNSASMVLFHNHPSGDPNPSADDVQFTKQATHHAQALDVQIVDHLIVAGSSVYSMANAGLLK